MKNLKIFIVIFVFSVGFWGFAASANTGSTTPQTYKKCIDSDGGKDFYKSGAVSITSSPSSSQASMQDYCGSAKTIIEYYCDGDKAGKISYDCDCKNGACVFSSDPGTTTPDIVLNWQRVENGLDNNDNFVSGNKPSFSFENNILNFNAGQVKQGASYRGYYYSDVDLKNNFELKFKTKIDTGNTDSNALYIYLSDSTKDGFYNFASSTDNSFYAYIDSGRSYWKSLYGTNQGGAGFELIGARMKNVSRNGYSNVYDAYLGSNMYGFKYTPKDEYTVKIQRKNGTVLFNIEKDGKSVHHWEAIQNQKVNYKYLTIGIANYDDNDNMGSSGPIGKIYDISLIQNTNNFSTSTIRATQIKSVTTSPVKFIKDPNSSSVYKIDESAKKIESVKNESEFKNLIDSNVSDWSVVENVSAIDFKKYIKEYSKATTTANVIQDIQKIYDEGARLIKSPTSSSVFMLSKDKNGEIIKKAIINSSVFEKLKLKWSDIKEFTNVDSVLKGEDITQ